VCGNGILEYNEQCEPPNSAGCSSVCEKTTPVCGNNIKEGDEECDGGYLPCNDDCTLAVCGNGILEYNEQCEPPNSAGCSSVCENEGSCGDGNVDDGEECDPPDGVTCSSTCLTTHGGGGNGDPHFKTWAGSRYDFHGACDLILFQSSQFKAHLGVDLHIRTAMRRDMSYISNAALRIGTDLLEVTSRGIYYLNGVRGANMPNEISGFPIAHSQPNENQHVFDVALGDEEHIHIKTYKDLVSVMVDGAQSKNFGDVVGLMGTLKKGHMLARDGDTVLSDHNAFGQEWQVLDTEPKLFQTVRFPQYPQVCTMPLPAQTSLLRRRLSESKDAELAAEKACAHWGDGKADCVFDVLATGDLEMAEAGAY
jgi:hypothetical protein